MYEKFKTLLLTIIICRSIATKAAKCVSPEVISPCMCDNNNYRLITCGGDNDFNLSQVFQTIITLQNHSVETEHAFVLKNTGITELSANVFDGINLVLITIESAYNLRKIDSKAFQSVNSFVKYIYIYNTPLDSISSEDGSIFDGMVSVEEIILSNTSIIALNRNAFNGLMNLSTLTIEHNSQLKTLDSNTFNNLVNLDYLILDNNAINKLTDYVFNFPLNTQINKQLEIRLINDPIITSNSFTSLTFASIERPLDLYLISLSSLTYLDERIFLKVLSDGNRITVWNTNLVCDCRMYWLYENKVRFETRIKLDDCTNGESLFRMTQYDNNCKLL